MRDLVWWFVVLAEEENVTAAAERLHIPQPTLSRRLARLEKHLGTTLFDRSGKRLRLNAAGRVYAEHLRRAHTELAAAEQAVHELAASGPRVVHLGFLHSFGTWLVPELIQRTRSVDPGLSFDLVQDAAEVITAKVVSGEVDLGIVSPRPRDVPVSWHRLLRQQVHLAVPTTNPLARRRSVAFSELRDAEFVSMAKRFGMRRLLDEACEAVDFEPHITVECQELDTVAGLVAAGIGVALLPDSPDRRLPSGVTTLRVTGVDAARDVGLIWARGAGLSEPARRVRELATSR
ncbi:LysR family transcriptional regulator [Flexivirga oryzae]|uniref:DNA-binding transcriptional LysR family regulator n=1 Tax=Flexivirga oryzae TaxID=1794944 RepID=A0A839N127_9MICO|nr:LysR family transcriptional regulator [Flexivirga oryzae]MBB2890519.1 DNA-binding transcriptional LysR family regulator [Flexivirga oryzae]